MTTRSFSTNALLPSLLKRIYLICTPNFAGLEEQICHFSSLKRPHEKVLVSAVRQARDRRQPIANRVELDI